MVTLFKLETVSRHNLMDVRLILEAMCAVVAIAAMFRIVSLEPAVLQTVCIPVIPVMLSENA